MLSIPTTNVDDTQATAPEIFGGAVDLSVLADYEEIQLDGEPDLVVELIDLYIQDAPRRVAAMHESVARRNWRLLKREAHSLRGSSDSLGAVEVGLICTEIEGAEFESPGAGINLLLSRLERGLERALHAFLAERERRTP